MFDRKAYYEKTKKRQRETARMWRLNHPERHVGNNNTYRRKSRDKNPVRSLLTYARNRAKTKGVPFDIEHTDITVPTHCPILGVELEYMSKERGENSASLDRIVPALGYVRGNVIIISWRANRIKCDATLDELKAMVKFYDEVAQRKSAIPARVEVGGLSPSFVSNW